jgi:pyrroline-5-carboxylate reductase
MKVLIWGCGNMARSFALGLRRSESAEFFCWNPSKAKAGALASELGGHVVTDVIPAVDAVVLGFKPQKLTEASSALELALGTQKPLIVSLLAAVELAQLKSVFAGKRVLRVMPNLPIKDGQGVVLWNGDELDATAKSLWQKRFDQMGLAPQLPEALIDLYTLHAGCSPAFLYAWIDEAAQFAVKNGGEAELAKRILIEAWNGALSGLKNSTLDMQLKIQEVASRGGVTRAALDGFAQNPNYIEQGFAAGLKRIEELKSPR